MKTIPVNVTQEHIKRGVRSSERFCPVRLAMLDEGAIRLPPEVGSSTLWWPAYPSLGYWPAPDSVTAWIARYDRGEAVEPIIFNFDLPEDVLNATF